MGLLMDGRRSGVELGRPKRPKRMVFVAVVALLAGLLGWAAPASAATEATGPFEVDVNDREAVRRFYQSVYREAGAAVPGWTGDLATCNAGVLSPAYLDATLSRVNWFRAMAGLPSNVTFTAEQNALAQAASVLQATRPATSPGFDHSPPATWRCFSQAGFQGSQQSNLGGTGPGAIDGWMFDPGANNAATGHRRHILAPGQVRMGHGGVPGDAGALHVFGARTNPPPTPRDTFVAWPNRGFVPYPVVWSRWSFLLPPAADVSAATVTMRRGATDIAVRIIERESNSGFGDSALNWQPSTIGDDATWARPAADETYTITVAGVVLGGVTRTFTYDVTIFDPAVADPTATRAVITGPDRVAVGQPSEFTFTAVPQATGYELRSAAVTPLSFADGAEAGVTNFDAVVDQYPVVSTIRAATGTSSFRLSTGQPRRDGSTSSRQTLTFRQLLLPGPDSRLRFSGLAIGLTNVDAVVEASVDGTNWTTVFREAAQLDAQFGARTVSLAAFAGQAVQLRFRVENTGTGATACCGGEGWYLDDLALDGVEAVATPTLTAVPLGTTFGFTPATPTEHLLQLRPVFFGTGAGDWGPVKRTSAAPPAVPPAITAQPAPVTVTAPAPATLSVVAAGTGPLTFSWRRDRIALVDGNGVAGAGTPSLTITPAVPGEYDVVVTNRAGTVTSAAVTVTVLQPPAAPTLADALDVGAANPVASAPVAWTGQQAVTHDGVDAAQSGRITANQTSTASLTVTGPARVAFWWRVSSEASFDFLSASLDGAAPAAADRISGTVEWTQKSLDVPAGTHTVTWTYSKDGSVDTGTDAGWIDEVTITAAQNPPNPPPATPTMADALDVGAATRATGDAPWVTQAAVTRDGIDAAQSGRIGANQASGLQMLVAGPATVTFSWRVNSELNFDFLSVSLDGAAPAAADRISGTVEWAERTITVPAGFHTLTWTYSKDESVDTGADAGWVDQVRIS